MSGKFTQDVFNYAVMGLNPRIISDSPTTKLRWLQKLDGSMILQQQWRVTYRLKRKIWHWQRETDEIDGVEWRNVPIEKESEI